MSQRQKEYTLFIDESGQFGEEALKNEREQERPSSQICGILLPGTFEKRKRGDDLPAALLKLFPKGEIKHAVDLSHEYRAKLVQQVLKQTSTSDWRLVRLVNNSGLGEGDLITTYTRMVAELIVCIYQALCEEKPHETPLIHLTYAQVLLGKRIDGRDYYFSRGEVTPQLRQLGSPIMIPILDYKEAISRELQIDLKYGLGLNIQNVDRVFGQIIEESARIHPALQLSDLISNCSYKRGRALRHFPKVRQKLLNTLEPYDFELHSLKPQYIAQELANHRALGQAITFILTYQQNQNLNSQAHQCLLDTLDELIEDLAEEHSDELRSDLEAILNAVEDLVERERDASQAEVLIQSIFEQVLSPLTKKMVQLWGKANLDWFEFRLVDLALMNANYSGQFKLSKQRIDSLNTLRTKVCNRWEELPVVMRSQLNIAVSLADRFQFKEGLALAEEVCGFYQDMSELISAFRGQDLISLPLKVKNHMSALGTTLMLERYLCLEYRAADQDIKSLVVKGRQLGEQALALSESKEDQQRLWQQLAHLEALAGQFQCAWQALLLGVGIQESNESEATQNQREAMLNRLDETSDINLRFPMFHVLRLTNLELQQESHCEDSLGFEAYYEGLSTLFIRRFQTLLNGEIDDYPAHGILRVWAVFNALRGEEAVAIGALRVLERLVNKQEAIALQLISLMAQIEVVMALVGIVTHDRVNKLISQGVQHKKEGQRSIYKQMTQLKKMLKDELALTAWLDQIEQQIKLGETLGFDTVRRQKLNALCARYSG